MATNFEETLQAATSRGSQVIPGAVLSAIDSTGKQLYHKVAGYNGLSADAAPLQADATFWVASCTKLAASIAALQCVERGLVTLDEPVEKHLPELNNSQIVSMQDGKAHLQAAKNKITLRHLLTHTSGFSYEWTSPTLLAWRKGAPYKTNPAGTVTTLYDTPLLFEPGEGWAYGPGIDWAGILVERLNGDVTLGEYLHKNVFERLGSKGESTTFRLDSPAAKEARIRERLLPNAHRQDDGKLIEQSYGFSQVVKQDSGGAGWYSSVSDYMVILQDVIAAEPKLLKRENVEEWLFKGHIQHKNAISQLLSARTGMTPEEGDAAGEAPINYSLGGMFCAKDSVLPKGTLTWGGLPNLKWFANREKGLAAMFATQLTPSGDKQAQDLAAEYFKEVWKIYKSRNSS